MTRVTLFSWVAGSGPLENGMVKRRVNRGVGGRFLTAALGQPLISLSSAPRSNRWGHTVAAHFLFWRHDFRKGDPRRASQRPASSSHHDVYVRCPQLCSQAWHREWRCPPGEGQSFPQRPRKPSLRRQARLPEPSWSV